MLEHQIKFSNCQRNLKFENLKWEYLIKNIFINKLYYNIIKFKERVSIQYIQIT